MPAHDSDVARAVENVLCWLALDRVTSRFSKLRAHSFLPYNGSTTERLEIFNALGRGEWRFLGVDELSDTAVVGRRPAFHY